MERETALKILKDIWWRKNQEYEEVEIRAAIAEGVRAMMEAAKIKQEAEPKMVCPFRTETIKTESGTREIYPECETIRCPFYIQESTTYGLFCPAGCGRAEKEKE